MNGGRNLLGLRPPFIFTSTIMKQRILLVENQVKSLATIEPKACIARYERQMFGDGVGDDYVVGRGSLCPCTSLVSKWA